MQCNLWTGAAPRMRAAQRAVVLGGGEVSLVVAKVACNSSRGLLQSISNLFHTSCNSDFSTQLLQSTPSDASLSLSALMLSSARGCHSFASSFRSSDLEVSSS